MSTPLLGALDIGTQTTRLVAGELTDGRIKVLGQCSVVTSGVKKGVIRNIDDVVGCLRQARKEMSERHKLDIFDVCVSFSAAGINTLVRTGRKSLLPGHAIDDGDVMEAEDNAGSAEAPDSPEILLQRFRQKYEVNGQPVSMPVGMTGSELIANVLELTAPRSAVEALRTAVHRAGFQATDIVFSAVADAEAVLSGKIRDEGALVIDFGAGTTDYIAICNGVVAAAGALGIGGSHLTNDLALAFQIPQAQAEVLKLARGAAMIQQELANERYALRTSPLLSDDRSISVHAVQTVTTERVDETLRILRDILQERGLLTHLHGGVYLVGGTAKLPLISEHASDIFGLPCRVGVPVNTIGTLPPEMTEEPFRHATAIGLLNWRARTLAQEEHRPGLMARLRALLRG